MRNQENDFEEKKVADALSVIADQVKNYRDPIELKKVFKLFKKSIPFSLRSYVIGFVVKNAAQSGHFRIRQERHATEQRKFFDESVADTLFISIGRNRRVFARDIVGILTHAAEIDRDHIGAIKILDNYSFVQILSADAAQVIERLNGYTYRGRKLAVSYSRKKDGSEQSFEESTTTDDSALVEDQVIDSTTENTEKL